MKITNFLAFAVIFLFCGTISVWAQSANIDLPAEVNAADATITKMGHATVSMKKEVVVDSLTLTADTIVSIESIEWNTTPGTAKVRMVQRRAITGSDFYDQDSNWWYDIWWFSYNYPSINANGEEVLLTSMACMPDDDDTEINKIIVGCHITITSNKECPSRYNAEGSSLSDVSMLMNLAGSSGAWAYNLVILPDYEGYGITKNNAHPYLYQELTARQVVDAVRYGRALYQTSPQVNEVRHAFRSNWRTICIGYSQGGSVALATQRFIEQNGLTDELQLAGSICGDGPYDLMATLMYYMDNDIQGKVMSMPVVLPLILKGMCDSNPYMINHQVSDYLDERFLETGIISWLTSKDKTTDDITDAWKDLYENGKDGDKSYFHDVLTEDGLAYLNKIMKPEGYEYFKALYLANANNYTSSQGIPLPTHRGVMEDLHFALESNNLTVGWQPQHAIILYHSTEDTVVPEKNRERAYNTLGNWVIRQQASGSWDHVGQGRTFYLPVAGCQLFEDIKVMQNAPVHQTLTDLNNIKNQVGSVIN